MYGRKLSLFSRSSSIFRQKPKAKPKGVKRQPSKQPPVKQQPAKQRVSGQAAKRKQLMEAEAKRKRIQEAKRKEQEAKRQEEEAKRKWNEQSRREKEEEARRKQNEQTMRKNHARSEGPWESSKNPDNQHKTKYVEKIKKDALMFALSFCKKLKALTSLEEVLELETMAMIRKMEVTKLLKEVLGVDDGKEEEGPRKTMSMVAGHQRRSPNPSLNGHTTLNATPKATLNEENLSRHEEVQSRNRQALPLIRGGRQADDHGQDNQRLGACTKAVSIVSLIKGKPGGGSMRSFLSEEGKGRVMEKGELPLFKGPRASSHLSFQSEPFLPPPHHRDPVNGQEMPMPAPQSKAKPCIEPDETQLEIHNPLGDRGSIGSRELSLLKEKLSIC